MAFFVGVLTMMRKNKNITLNNICASVWSQWQRSESKGKVGQLSKQWFFFPKHRWKTDMTFSLRLQCSALCVCFLLCSSEIRRGADEPSEQHRRRRGDVSALKVFALEQESCFRDKGGARRGTGGLRVGVTKDRAGQLCLSDWAADLHVNETLWRGWRASVFVTAFPRNEITKLTHHEQSFHVILFHISIQETSRLRTPGGTLKKKKNLQVTGWNFHELHYRQTNHFCCSIVDGRVGSGSRLGDVRYLPVTSGV